MKLYIFNPEHDIALASNLENFTAPHAGRQLRHDLGFLPALWADADDYVLVDDKGSAEEALRRLPIDAGATLIEPWELKALCENVEKIDIVPWGWDIAIRHDLKIQGVPLDSLPANAWLNNVRLESHRAWAATNLLMPLRKINGTVGESHELKSVEEVRKLLSMKHSIVLKAPWSSSGRGIRYISDNENVGKDANNNSSTYYGLTPQLEGWIRNVVRHQGSVMAEPYYNRVCDFGMEFFSRGNGVVDYRGLSVFQTVNGAYTGNILDDEAHKKAILCRYLPQQQLSEVANDIKIIMSKTLGNSYAGPFGIDMMVVRDGDRLLLHPCVELNLRMTMGYVALLLAEKHGFEEKVMRINYAGGKYRLWIGG